MALSFTSSTPARSALSEKTAWSHRGPSGAIAQNCASEEHSSEPETLPKKVRTVAHRAPLPTRSASATFARAIAFYQSGQLGVNALVNVAVVPNKNTDKYYFQQLWTGKAAQEI